MAEIMIQSTPNPNALKYILDKNVIREGKITYKNASECGNNKLAEALFDLSFVEAVHFFENVITVTKSDGASWDEAAEDVRGVIDKNLADHNSDISLEPAGGAKENLSPEIIKIEEILDRTIRPGLQGDGGDLRVISLEGNVLSIHYEGACGGCPSAAAGTLEAIKGILRDEYDPNLELVAV